MVKKMEYPFAKTWHVFAMRTIPICSLLLGDHFLTRDHFKHILGSFAIFVFSGLGIVLSHGSFAANPQDRPARLWLIRGWGL